MKSQFNARLNNQQPKLQEHERDNPMTAKQGSGYDRQRPATKARRDGQPGQPVARDLVQVAQQALAAIGVGPWLGEGGHGGVSGARTGKSWREMVLGDGQGAGERKAGAGQMGNGGAAGSSAWAEVHGAIGDRALGTARLRGDAGAVGFRETRAEGKRWPWDATTGSELGPWCGVAHLVARRESRAGARSEEEEGAMEQG